MNYLTRKFSFSDKKQAPQSFDYTGKKTYGSISIKKPSDYISVNNQSQNYEYSNTEYSPLQRYKKDVLLIDEKEKALVKGYNPQSEKYFSQQVNLLNKDYGSNLNQKQQSVQMEKFNSLDLKDDLLNEKIQVFKDRINKTTNYPAIYPQVDDQNQQQQKYQQQFEQSINQMKNLIQNIQDENPPNEKTDNDLYYQQLQVQAQQNELLFQQQQQFDFQQQQQLQNNIKKQLSFQSFQDKNFNSNQSLTHRERSLSLHNSKQGNNQQIEKNYQNQKQIKNIEENSFKIVQELKKELEKVKSDNKYQNQKILSQEDMLQDFRNLYSEVLKINEEQKDQIIFLQQERHYIFNNQQSEELQIMNSKLIEVTMLKNLLEQDLNKREIEIFQLKKQSQNNQHSDYINNPSIWDIKQRLETDLKVLKLENQELQNQSNTTKRHLEQLLLQSKQENEQQKLEIVNLVIELDKYQKKIKTSSSLDKRNSLYQNNNHHSDHQSQSSVASLQQLKQKPSMNNNINSNTNSINNNNNQVQKQSNSQQDQEKNVKKQKNLQMQEQIEMLQYENTNLQQNNQKWSDLFKQIQNSLQEQNFDNILKKIQKTYKEAQKYTKVTECIIDMMVKCTNIQDKKTPDYKEAWKWLKQIVVDYFSQKFKIKIFEEQNQQLKQFCNHIGQNIFYNKQAPNEKMINILQDLKQKFNF